MRGMVGAKVDYVVMQVDREGECAIASLRSALAKQRRHFMAVRGVHEPGEAPSWWSIRAGYWWSAAATTSRSPNGI